MKSIRSCAAAILALACLGSSAYSQDSYNFRTLIGSGLSAPLGLEFPPGDNTRAFIVEQGGRIRIATLGSDVSGNPTMTLVTTPLLDLAALDTASPFWVDGLGNPLRDQTNTIIPRLIRSGGTPVSSGGNSYAVVRGGEQGLLGLAFAPDFATSGKFYINLTQNNPNTTTGVVPFNLSGNGTVNNPYQASTPGRTAIVEYRIDPNNPNQILAGSERLILAFPQTFTNHNGGCVEFGPDGMLWIGTGDGGSGDDPLNDALDPNEFLGKMLRINPIGDDFPADALRNYTIPAGNTYPGGVGGRPEIWARGKRNPWRFSFDRWNDDLWIGDVGQNLWEEVNRVPSTATGLNFGWRVREGFATTSNPAGGFDVSNLTPPIYVYPHGATQAGTNNAWSSTQTGVSIAGGVVYRGNIRGLRGRYFFADTYRTQLWAFPANVVPTSTGWLGTPAQVGLTDLSAAMRNQAGDAVVQPALANVVAFAEDNQSEMYIVEIAGRIRKVVPAGTQPLLADTSGPNQSTTLDGAFTADDIIVYLGWFFANDPRADVAGPNQSPLVDQALTADDIIVFLSAYFEGR